MLSYKSLLTVPGCFVLGEWDVADLGVESSVVDQSIHSTVTSSSSRGCAMARGLGSSRAGSALDVTVVLERR